MTDEFAHRKAGKDNPEDYEGRHDDSLVPAPHEGPLADPGLPEHLPRPTDVDPKLEKRAERQIVAMFSLAGVFSILFCVAYFAIDNGVDGDTIFGYGASNLALGLTMGLALVLLGAGAIQWARKLMADQEIIEYRHPTASAPEDRAESLAAFEVGVEESGFGRRKMIRNSLLGGVGLLGLPTIVLLRDLGPLPGTKLEETVWTKGVRVVQDVDGKPLTPADLMIGQLVNAEPDLFFEHEDADGNTVPAEYEGVELQIERAKAAVIVVRMAPDDITPAKGKENWGIDGILCYSKICTHVGCPISLWDQRTHQVLCPCHQSTFDLADNGKVLFGPAARPLPQLPIGVDDEGYIIAMSGFHEPVGASFWERG